MRRRCEVSWKLATVGFLFTAQAVGELHIPTAVMLSTHILESSVVTCIHAPLLCRLNDDRPPAGLWRNASFRGTSVTCNTCCLCSHAVTLDVPVPFAVHIVSSHTSFTSCACGLVKASRILVPYP